MRRALGQANECWDIELAWVPSHGKVPRKKWEVPAGTTESQARQVNDRADKEASAVKTAHWEEGAADQAEYLRKWKEAKDWCRHAGNFALEVYERYERHLRSISGFDTEKAQAGNVDEEGTDPLGQRVRREGDAVQPAGQEPEEEEEEEVWSFGEDE